jgi:hypothetical protein
LQKTGSSCRGLLLAISFTLKSRSFPLSHIPLLRFPGKRIRPFNAEKGLETIGDIAFAVENLYDRTGPASFYQEAEFVLLRSPAANPEREIPPCITVKGSP